MGVGDLQRAPLERVRVGEGVHRLGQPGAVSEDECQLVMRGAHSPLEDLAGPPQLLVRFDKPPAPCQRKG